MRLKIDLLDICFVVRSCHILSTLACLFFSVYLLLLRSVSAVGVEESLLALEETGLSNKN